MLGTTASTTTTDTSATESCTTATESNTSSCGCTVFEISVEELILKIKELVRRKKGAELQAYVECIENWCDVWFVMDRYLIFDIIFLVPKWDVEIICTLFNIFKNDHEIFELLKTCLPLSFQIAADN